MHFIYYILGIKEAYLLLYFKYILNYIKRRYSFKVKIFYKNCKILIQLRNKFIAFIIKKSLVIKSSFYIYKLKIVILKDLKGL
jgi:hypothetical protein